MPSSPALRRPSPASPGRERLLSCLTGGLTAAAAVLLAVAPLGAATVCVGSSAELQNALDTAESNGVDDTILVKTGTYPVPGGGFKYLSSEAKNLNLIGGHIVFLGGSCVRLDSSPFGTVLDGGGQERVLALTVNLGAGGTGSPHLRVEGLKLANGDGGFGDAGVGLTVQVAPVSVSPTVEVIGNALVGNSTQGASGGLDISVGSSATVRVSGNLFVDNHCLGQASALSLSGGISFDAAVNNNTFVGNVGGTSVVSLNVLSASGTVWASNNIVWSNGGDYDFHLSGVGVSALVANDYPRPLNVAPTLEVDRIQLDPRFIDPASNWDLLLDSPLSGRGASPPYGGLGTKDLLGRPRTVGARVDVGAYEIQKLHSDGFESGTLAVWSDKNP